VIVASTEPPSPRRGHFDGLGELSDEWLRMAAPDLPICRPASPPPTQGQRQIIGVIRVIEDQITTLRPYNARYTGDHRSIFRKRYAEMITRVSLDLVSYQSNRECSTTVAGKARIAPVSIPPRA
jgi:hypothetical protein